MPIIIGTLNSIIMMKHTTSALLPLLLCLSVTTNADVYYWKNADGSLMATDQPPPAGTEFRTERDLQAVNNWQQHAAPQKVSDAKENQMEEVAPDNNELITVKLSPNAPPQEIKPAAVNADSNVNTDISALEKSTSEKNTEKKVDNSAELAIGAIGAIGNVTQTENDESENEVTAETLKPNDEAGCQKLYGTNCDKVFNWRQYGEKYCQNFKNEKCSDAKWFENRFKPLTIAERQKRTLRNAAKKNREVGEIRDYLQRKYTGICAIDPAKAPLLCNNAAYDAKILASFQKLSGKDQAEIKRLQQILKTSKDRSLTDRTIEQILSYLPWAAATANGL